MGTHRPLAIVQPKRSTEWKYQSGLTRYFDPLELRFLSTTCFLPLKRVRSLTEATSPLDIVNCFSISPSGRWGRLRAESEFCTAVLRPTFPAGLVYAMSTTISTGRESRLNPASLISHLLHTTKKELQGVTLGGRYVRGGETRRGG